VKKTSEMSVSELKELAETLVESGLLPQTVNSPAKAFAIILADGELGLEPMAALRNLQVVRGKVIEAADSQLGRFKVAGGSATFEVLTDTEARLVLVHPNGKDTHTEEFSVADAKRAGLGGNVWKSYPRAMLRSRCITAGLKSVGFLGAAGMYDPNEAKEFLPDVEVPSPSGEEAENSEGQSERHWSENASPKRKATVEETSEEGEDKSVRERFFAAVKAKGMKAPQAKKLILEVTGSEEKSKDSKLLTEEDLGLILDHLEGVS